MREKSEEKEFVMKHHAKPSSGRNAAPKAIIQSEFISKPIDGRQYLEVVEEQEYAEQRPTVEENRPRYSYLKKDQLK
jgi:hypothetical protein